MVAQVEGPDEIISRNLGTIREEIRAAAVSARRDPASVRLVAVTKSVSAAAAGILVKLGVRDIGENRVQDALSKAKEIPAKPDLTWHMIGHLQRNKVKKALGLFRWIHSVDSIRLAEEIDKQAAVKRLAVPVFLEVNVSGEETKFGFRPEEIKEALAEMARFRCLEVKGLMTMAPLASSSEASRPFFRALRELKDELNRSRVYPNVLEELSMGMSQDFTVAVEEGATMIRLGTVLFKGLPEDFYIR